MKHAYLILAHDFDILPYLLEVIDDVRNDIFIHIDKKVTHIPDLTLKAARLYWLNNRVDVRWGDVSILQAEFSLFERAVAEGEYAYYHLLSGADLPLQSQNRIHDFFDKHQGKEFIGYSQYDYRVEVDRKVNRYHLFAKDFRGGSTLRSKMRKVIRAAALRVQFLFNIRRNTDIELKKGTQWVSVTGSFVSFILQQKKEILNRYQYTFCADEIFIQTVCWHSAYRKQVFDTENEGKGCMRIIGWKDGKLIDWSLQDYGMLIQSGALFARKFNKNELPLIHRIINHIKSNDSESQR